MELKKRRRGLFHHFKTWRKLLNTLPATAENIEYGTPEMANEIARLFNEQKLSQHKIFAMAGHYEGVVSFGKNLAQAAELLLNEFGDVTNLHDMRILFYKHTLFFIFYWMGLLTPFLLLQVHRNKAYHRHSR